MTKSNSSFRIQIKVLLFLAAEYKKKAINLPFPYDVKLNLSPAKKLQVKLNIILTDI